MNQAEKKGRSVMSQWDMLSQMSHEELLYHYVRCVVDETNLRLNTAFFKGHEDSKEQIKYRQAKARLQFARRELLARLVLGS